MEDGMTDPPPLFAGLKVIDCATYIAAPTAATVLADYGAEVIKIEAPGDGDPWRHTYLRPGLPDSPHNYPWLVDNRNKRGLALDLKHAAGRAVLDRLVAQSDIFHHQSAAAGARAPARALRRLRGPPSAPDLRLRHRLRRGRPEAGKTASI